MKKVKLLKHQSQFIQAPNLFPKYRFFILVAGYGSGKSSSISKAVLNSVKSLQGKVDTEGHSPVVGLGGVTYSHLEKTTLAMIKEDLDASKTVYRHDTKNNLIEIGNVRVILYSLSEPSKIVGQNIHCFYADEIDDLGTSSSDDLTFEAVKAINERTRQVIKGMRKPYICMGCFAAGTKVQTEHGYQSIETITPNTMVMTRTGYKRVLRQWQTGLRDTVNLHGVDLTPEHRVWDESKQDWVEARYIDNSSMGIVSSYDEVEKWKNLLLSMEQALGTLQSLLMEYDTTGVITKQRNKDITEVVQVLCQVEGYTSQYMKVLTEKLKMGAPCTTSMVTQVITALRTLQVSPTKNTTPTMRTIDILNTFVRTAGSTNTPGHQTLQCVKNANTRNERNKEESEHNKLEQAPTKELGKNKSSNVNVLHVEPHSQQVATGRTNAQNATGYKQTSTRRTMPEKRAKKQGLAHTSVCVPYAETPTQQKGHQHSVHRNVGTGQELLEHLRLLVPTAVSELAPVAKYSECAGSTKEPGARSVPVYDIEVEGSHEFFVKTEIGDLLVHNSTSQGQKGLYRVYTQFIKTGAAFILIRGSTRDNPHLDPEYVESLYKMYNEVERKVFLEGYFLPISTGRVFGDFDWGRNFVHTDMDQQISDEETVYWAQDFNTGYFRGCVGVERGGRIYIVKGYDFPDIREAPEVVRHDFPHNKIVWIPDTTAKDQISHFTKELRKHRIHWIQRGKNPLVEDSAFLVNKLFYTKRLFFTAMAKDVAEACALAQRDKNGKIPKGIGPNSPIHFCDGVRMLTYFLASNKRSLRDIRRVTIARHLEMYEEEAAITELEGGYRELNPAAL